jgi:hypothetical protein
VSGFIGRFPAKICRSLKAFSAKKSSFFVEGVEEVEIVEHRSAKGADLLNRSHPNLLPCKIEEQRPGQLTFPLMK